MLVEQLDVIEQRKLFERAIIKQRGIKQLCKLKRPSQRRCTGGLLHA